MLRNYGYRAVFILGASQLLSFPSSHTILIRSCMMAGLLLEGIGALLMWPAGLKRSFGGFCGATFIIGSGLGCLETAANPYMAGQSASSVRFRFRRNLMHT